MTEANRSTVLRRVTTELYLDFPLPQTPGARHYCVVARNGLGGEGPMSNEIQLDSTLRLAWLARLGGARGERLYMAGSTGWGQGQADPAVQVATDLPEAGWRVADFAFSPDGALLACRADRERSGTYSLYLSSSAGDQLVRRVDLAATATNATLHSVEGYQFAPDLLISAE